MRARAAVLIGHLLGPSGPATRHRTGRSAAGSLAFGRGCRLLTWRRWDELIANKEQGILPLFKSSVVRPVMRKGAQVQARALLGEDAEAEAPLFVNGLVPSADGLFWSVS
jgi:hypothetical protein